MPGVYVSALFITKILWTCLCHGGTCIVCFIYKLIKLSPNINIDEGATTIIGDEFAEFYRESSNVDSFDPNHPHFPRLINLCIDSYDYYNVEKFNSNIQIYDSDLKFFLMSIFDGLL